MKIVFSFLTLLIAGNLFAQQIDINWQGYVNTGADSVRGSFYLAGPNLDLTTAFNDRNYPVWYSENQTLAVNGGVCASLLRNIPVDSLIKYDTNLWLYVTVNGQPFEKVKLQYVPYSAYSLYSFIAKRADAATFATSAGYADTSAYARNSGVADSSVRASHAVNATNAVHSDSADNANHSVYADTARYAIQAVRSSLADNAQFAILADSAKKAGHASNADNAVNSVNAQNAVHSQTSDVATFAQTIADNSVTSPKIVNGTIQRVDIDNGIIDETALASNSVTTTKIVDGTVAVVDVNVTGTPTNFSTLGYNNGNFEWVSSNQLYLNSIQNTTVIPTQINSDARWVVLKVAHDFNLVGMTATEGRVVTIVNASTANFVTMATPDWNIFGGTLVISPRSSRTLVYLNSEWIVIQ